MRKVDLKVGFKCNNRCKFCVQGDKRKRTIDKPLNVIRKELRIGRKKAEAVVFTGGEVTLRLSELIEMVEVAKELEYSIIQIQTNGRLFSYNDFCQRIIAAGANQFSIALHGHNSKIHDFLTGASGSFEQARQGIINLKNLRQYVSTNTVITNYNYKYLPSIAQFLVNLNVNQYQFAFPHILGTARDNCGWLIPKKIKVMPYVKKGLDIGIKAKKLVMTEAIPFCLMKGYEEHIAERIIPDTKIFDAYFTIDNYTKYRRLTGKIKSDKCKICKYYRICEGPWREYPEIFGWSEFIPVK